MRRLALLLATLALTACAPVVITVAAPVTPIVRDLSPQEAMGVVIDATNTAAAVATRDAYATAGEQNARATSTTAAQLTREALQVEQTRTALQITVAAAAGLATDGAAVRTQSAQQTQAWATPTAAAMRTQAAVTVADRQREQASAESAAAFWNLLRWVLLAAIAGIVIVVCVLILVRGVAFIFMETIRERAAVAREAFKILAPGHWAEWTATSGYQVYQLPGALDAPPTIVENAIVSPSRLHAWRHTVRLFAWWGDRYGFGVRDLAAAGAGVVTDPVWRDLSKLLKDAGALDEVRRDGQKGRVTAWADGWDYRRFADELDSGRLELPFPEKGDPPKVAFAVPTQHHI